MKELFRRLVIKYFVDSKLLSQELANNLLSWKHSGFSIDNSVRISASDDKARESIAQHMARCPISLNKIMRTSCPNDLVQDEIQQVFQRKP